MIVCYNNTNKQWINDINYELFQLFIYSHFKYHKLK